MINPNDFKDHMKIDTKVKPITAPKVSNNVYEIEGIEPLFMESLSAQGLQNIADSH